MSMTHTQPTDLDTVTLRDPGRRALPREAPPATRRHRAPVTWRPDSWRDHPADQQPHWEDTEALDRTIGELEEMPPLVLPAEIDDLRDALASVAAGQGILLQAGDCAERFESTTEQCVRNKLRVILQFAVLLTYGSGLPVVKVGRIAGQFGKPRSSPTEVVDGVDLPVFRGDIVNGSEPTAEARRPDPRRMRRAYDHAAATLNVLRALTHEGFADLNQVHAWNQEFVRDSPAGQHYETAADDVTWALRFMAACGAEPDAAAAVHQTRLYTSHEALLPTFEQALTRRHPTLDGWVDTSAHMVWAGDRTRALDGAHVEYLSGIANPVGVKIGPSTTPDDVRGLCERLDPGRVPGRLVLISRLGADRVTELLQPLIAAGAEGGRRPIWLCDPMHGNTVRAPSGYKTRRLEDITQEIDGFFAVHRHLGVHPGGVHLEMTGENVTECLGGADEVLDADLAARYESACDPRLNASQSIELAFRVASLLRRHRTP